MHKDQEEKYADQNDELQAEHAKCMPETLNGGVGPHPVSVAGPILEMAKAFVEESRKKGSEKLRAEIKEHCAEEDTTITHTCGCFGRTLPCDEHPNGLPGRDVVVEAKRELTGGPSTTSGVPDEAQAVLDDLEARRRDKENEKARVEMEKDFSAEIGAAILDDLEAKRKEKLTSDTALITTSETSGGSSIVGESPKEEEPGSIGVPYSDFGKYCKPPSADELERPMTGEELIADGWVWDVKIKKWRKDCGPISLTTPTAQDIKEVADAFADQGAKILEAAEEEATEKLANGMSGGLEAPKTDFGALVESLKADREEGTKHDDDPLKGDEIPPPGEIYVRQGPVEIRLPGYVVSDELTPTQVEIVSQCCHIQNILISKNRKYGDSLFNPPGVFSKAGTLELINSRLDDKLSRLQQGDIDEADRAEDEEDIIGYLILKRVYRALEGKDEK